VLLTQQKRVQITAPTNNVDLQAANLLINGVDPRPPARFDC
jgi:hypothetical protein